MNREEWEKRGADVVTRFVEKYALKHQEQVKEGGDYCDNQSTATADATSCMSSEASEVDAK